MYFCICVLLKLTFTHMYITGESRFCGSGDASLLYLCEFLCQRQTGMTHLLCLTETSLHCHVWSCHFPPFTHHNRRCVWVTACILPARSCRQLLVLSFVSGTKRRTFWAHKRYLHHTSRCCSETATIPHMRCVPSVLWGQINDDYRWGWENPKSPQNLCLQWPLSLA